MHSRILSLNLNQLVACRVKYLYTHCTDTGSSFSAHMTGSRDSSVHMRLTTDWKFQGSNPGEGDNFRTRPDRPWGPNSLLYNGYRVPFAGVEPPGRGVDHPPPSSAEAKERVELYLYSPSGPSCPVLGWSLPLHTWPSGVHAPLAHSYWNWAKVFKMLTSSKNTKFPLVAGSYR